MHKVVKFAAIPQIINSKEVISMPVQVPDYMSNVVNTSRDAFCDMLHNPALWSEGMIKKTLERAGGHPFNIQDAQLIIKDYLTVLSETIRKGESI
jgi:hypothetical protein